MSENIQNHTERMEGLNEFARRMVRGEKSVALWNEYRPLTSTVTPEEVMQVFDSLLVEGYGVAEVKEHVGKLVNVFTRPLNDFVWTQPGEGHFLYYLMLENRGVEQVMARLKAAVKTLFGKGGTVESPLDEMRACIQELREYELHYVKKENLLFPFMERVFPQFRCLQLMWAFHDDFRKSLRELDALLAPRESDLDRLNAALGALFFVVMPIVFREEKIVFPVAMRALPDFAWDEMLAQSYEIGWCYGVNPLPLRLPSMSRPEVLSGQGGIGLGTGTLSVSQIMLMLNALPVDITFVDEHDEVRYFSAGKHRIFPRSEAIIGRKVQNCHPPSSVHVVEQIIDAFRSGSRDHADFWIQSRGRFLHIRYFALRDERGNYCGTLEVSQDVTDIRSLEGEQRLLDWEE